MGFLGWVVRVRAAPQNRLPREAVSTLLEVCKGKLKDHFPKHCKVLVHQAFSLFVSGTPLEIR